MKLKVACFVTFSVALATVGTSLAHAKRRPLPRPTIDEKIEHAATGNSVRVNPKTGQAEEYPLEGEVSLDPKSGHFRLSWNGIDGRRKTLIWESPWNVDAVVAARVEYDPDGCAYRYIYSMQSLPTSKEKLQGLFVGVQAPVENVEAPDDTWYSRPLTKPLREKFEVTAGRAWSQAQGDLVGLPPGQKATGFSYTSAGLPGIVKCWVRANTKGHFAGEEAPDVLVDAIHRYNWMVPQGLTVGPADPPDPFVAGPFAEKISEYVSISMKQGWIESPAVGRVLIASTREIHELVAKGDRPGALKLISSVLARIEREKDKTLLPEAYALLRYNLEYLRTQVDQGSSSAKR